MNKISVYLCMFCFFLFCVTVTYYALRAYYRAKKQIKALEETIENQKKNLIYIVRHSQELADINGNRTKIDKEIAEAKTDEEVVNIINAVIQCNNDKLHNDRAE